MSIRHESARAGNIAGAVSGENRGHVFLQASKVWARYGVSFMTINRWIKDERVGFPKPIYLGRLRFWKLADLEAWEANQPAKGRPDKAQVVA